MRLTEFGTFDDRIIVPTSLLLYSFDRNLDAVDGDCTIFAFSFSLPDLEADMFPYVYRDILGEPPFFEFGFVLCLPFC
jgi:hypothetical protein